MGLVGQVGLVGRVGAAVLVVVCLGGATAPPRAAAPPQAPPRFDTVSLKASRTGGPPGALNLALPDGRVLARGASLRMLIAAAHQPQSTARRSQETIVGLPDWADSLRFDLDARAEGNPDVGVRRQLLQSLLADRFKLAVRSDTQQRPVFELVLAAGGAPGPQLLPHAAASPCTDQARPVGIAAGVIPAPPPPPPPCGGIRTLSAFWGESLTTRMAGNGVPVRALAEQLGWFQSVDRAVVDRTGLAGTFDFSMEWTPAEPSDAGISTSTPPGLAAALLRQLGLQLRPATGPVEVLVIDRVERPAED